MQSLLLSVHNAPTIDELQQLQSGQPRNIPISEELTDWRKLRNILDWTLLNPDTGKFSLWPTIVWISRPNVIVGLKMIWSKSTVSKQIIVYSIFLLLGHDITTFISHFANDSWKFRFHEIICPPFTFCNSNTFSRITKGRFWSSFKIIQEKGNVGDWALCKSDLLWGTEPVFALDLLKESVSDNSHREERKKLSIYIHFFREHITQLQWFPIPCASSSWQLPPSTQNLPTLMKIHVCNLRNRWCAPQMSHQWLAKPYQQDVDQDVHIVERVKSRSRRMRRSWIWMREEK